VLASQVNTEELISQILQSRKITRKDQHRLMSTLLSQDLLGEKERILIDQVFDGVRKGFLKVVD
jgi:transcriptional regulator CtsR